MKNTFIILLSLFINTIGNSQDWHQIPSGVTNQLNVIDFPSADIGYIGGNDSLLLKSTNGGATWERIDFSGVRFLENDIINLEFVSETTGYMVTGPYSNNIYKTIDGGFNWTDVATTITGTCYNYALYFFEEDNGFYGGSGCFGDERIIKVTDDEAEDAVLTGEFTSAAIRDIDFLNEDFGLAASGLFLEGRILRTTDGGLNWTIIETGLGEGYPLTSVKIINASLAYAGYDNLGEGFGLLKSTDGGLTWESDTETGTFYYPSYHAIHETGSNDIYVGARTSLDSTGLILENDPVSFVWNFYPVAQPIYSMDSYNDSIVWGVGENGYIVVNIAPSFLSLSEEKPETINLYPNPAANELHFEFAKTPTKIEIIDMNGKLIKRVDPSKKEMNISELSQGLYYLIVQFDSEISTAKFIKQ